jgi:D-alanyl-D-alanine carboxypeptidase
MTSLLFKKSSFLKSIIFFLNLFYCFCGEAQEKASLLLNVNSGELDYAFNPDIQHPPASLTKMMTIYLTFEALRKGDLSLHQPLVVPHEATLVEPSKLYLKEGDTITVEELILAMAVKSANDAAVTMAHHLGPGEKSFAEKMTAKAREIGMSNTFFYNASGLPHPRQTTTARDLATLGLSLYLHFPEYYHYFARPFFRYKKKLYASTNVFLAGSHHVDGIKTGYINKSKHNFVVSAVRDGQRYIAVILGAPSKTERNSKIARLLGMEAPPQKTVKEPKKKPVLRLQSRPHKGSKKVGPHRFWFVQIGSFRGWSTAASYAKKVRTSLAHKVTPIDRYIVVKESGHFKARFGPYTRADEAVKICSALEENKVSCLVISH